MKQYILSIFLIGTMNITLADEEFRKKLSHWQKTLTKPQKESMSELIQEYERAYVMKNHELIKHFESALQKIMDQWPFLYKPLADAKIFHESVKDFLVLHSKHKRVKQYIAAYNKFDATPTDQKLYNKLLDAQQNLENLKRHITANRPAY